MRRYLYGFTRKMHVLMSIMCTLSVIVDLQVKEIERERAKREEKN